MFHVKRDLDATSHVIEYAETASSLHPGGDGYGLPPQGATRRLQPVKIGPKSTKLDLFLDEIDPKSQVFSHFFTFPRLRVQAQPERELRGRPSLAESSLDKHVQSAMRTKPFRRNSSAGRARHS